MDKTPEVVNDETSSKKEDSPKENIMFKSFADKKKIPPLHVGLGVLAAGILALVLAYFFGFVDPGKLTKPFFDDDPLVGKNEILLVNPLTGVGYSREEAGPINDRPLGVVINNHTDARPQSGLAEADVVYEIVAEGGITRYIAFFLSSTPEKIGPVRSARDYFFIPVVELGDAMIMHIGWSPQALEAIQSWPVRSLNRGAAQFWRENPRGVASEHTAYVDGQYLRDLGTDLGWDGRRDFRSWSFKDDLVSAETDLIEEITVDFWNPGDYSATFRYDSESNSYLRFTGYYSDGSPVPTIDENSGDQVSVKNVVVQFADEVPVEGDEKNRLSYQLIGSGSGLVFTDGDVVEATWSKADREARTLFYDMNGEEITFNRGSFWVSVVPSRNVSQVNY
jgi:hypothetical protein